MVLVDYRFSCGHVKREVTPHKVFDLANLDKSRILKEVLLKRTIVYFAFQIRLLMEIQKKNKTGARGIGIRIVMQSSDGTI